METGTKPGKGWNIALWVVQILLAVAFGFGGFIKMTWSMDMLTAQMVWPGALPVWLVRFIGVSEFAAGIGLVLPALTRIRPSLTVLAATGLALVMLLAVFFHISRGEYSVLGTNLAFGAMAVFVAWGRSKKAPIHPR